MYTGNLLLPIGDKIKEELRDNVNTLQVDKAFAIVNQRLNAYMFFIAYAGETFPRRAWVYDIDNNQWTKWPVPETSCAGYLETDELNTGDLAWTVLMGTTQGLVKWLDEKSYQDYTGVNVKMVAESGDYAVERRTQYATVYRLHISYLDHGYTPLKVYTSTDGGDNYSDVKIVYIGQPDGSADGSLRIAYADLLETGKRFRVKIEHDDNAKIEITEFVIELEEQGWGF
jgi:hypothetical protein